jgi:serine-type D-Ala-D-Ala carboxypeptidase/endopeptidase
MMNKFILQGLTIGLILLSNATCNAATIDRDKLESALKTHVTAETKGVGLFVGVINGSQREFISVGRPDKTSTRTLDENSLYEIGSISKTFTGILLADMVLKGEVKLDDSAAKYLPKGITLPTRDGKQITLLNLATHSSSLPRMPDNFSPKDHSNPFQDYSVEDMYEFLSDHKLSRDIGSVAEYSNFGMGLLGHILALKAGLSYEELIKERILKPLAMNNTVITITRGLENQFTTGHDNTGTATSHWDIPTLAGAGAIRSTGKDMMAYLEANMGLIETPLSEAIELSHQFQREFGNETMAIGLSWIRTKTPTGNIIWHNGGTGGFRSYTGFDKENALGVVVLANSQENSDNIGQAILSEQIESLVIGKKIEIVLTRDQLLAYVGDYQLAPDFILTISEENGELHAQATGQGKMPVFASAENKFFFKVVLASLTFNKNSKGEVESLILHQNGNHLAAKVK